MKSPIYILIVSQLFLVSCIEEVSIPLSNDSTLSINGMITNQLGPHKIQIAYSYSFNDNPVFTPTDPMVFGANVQISDDQNNIIQLTEGKNGAYFTPALFSGTIGRSYTLQVTLNNGEVFLSNPERINPVGAIINEVCFENTLNEVVTAESTTKVKEVEFTVSFTDLAETKDFYRWGYQGVYELEAPLADVSPPCDPAAPPHPKCGPCEIPTKKCWATVFDNEFLKVDNDELFNGKAIKDYTVYSTLADRQFNFFYAANIELYSITENAFKYWEAVSTQLTNNGTIFEAPNYQIKGNMYDADNSERLVLGYFSASAVTTARVIVDGDQVPDVLFRSGPIDCTPSEVGCIPDTCIDCRNWPATNIKPNYWP